MLEKIKNELSSLVPKELATNLDFWYSIKDNGCLYIPMSFINYISHKYDYEVELISSLEIRKHIISIAKELSNDNFKLELYRHPPADFNQTYMVPVIPLTNVYNAKKVTRETIKDRKRLLQDTPLADFNE